MTVKGFRRRDLYFLESICIEAPRGLALGRDNVFPLAFSHSLSITLQTSVNPCLVSVLIAFGCRYHNVFLSCLTRDPELGPVLDGGLGCEGPGGGHARLLRPRVGVGVVGVAVLVAVAGGALAAAHPRLVLGFNSIDSWGLGTRTGTIVGTTSVLGNNKKFKHVSKLQT